MELLGFGIMNPCRTLQRVSILCLAAAAGATVRSSDAAPVTASYLRSLDSTSFLQKDGAESAVMSRSLQNNDSDFAYFVNYKAEFQVLRDPVCLSIPPVLFLSCRGSEIRLLNNSSMFSCGDSFLDGFQQTTLRCVPTCLTDDECQAVYLAIGGNTEDGPFGSLEFSCHGNTVDDLTAYFKMEGNDQGLCAASVSSDSRLVHIARLGVSCPSSNNNNNIAGDNTTVDHEGGAGRYYSYDDYYMECFYGTAIRTSSANVTEDASTTSNELASLYTCVEGDNCAGNECAIVVDQVLIKSYPDHFQETCLEPSIVLATLPPASETNATLFVNIVQFVASWSLLFDPVSGSFCSGNTPSIIIQCLDNSDLSFINGTDSVNCTMLSSDTMECIDTDRDVFVDRFTNIFYVSTPSL